jgi:hypothetical protein
MSSQDGKWEFEPEVLELINELMEKEPFAFLEAVEGDRMGLVFNGVVMQFQLRLGMTPAETVKRLDYWKYWHTMSWSFTCSRCGMEHRADGRPENMSVGGIGCVCGASYEITGWKQYHRDDTSDGHVTFSVAVDGQEISVKSLEEADKVLDKLGQGILINKVRFD